VVQFSAQSGQRGDPGLGIDGNLANIGLDKETEDTMSRLFGPMRQVGIVVRDIEKSMRHWVEVCGVGPWFYAEQLPLDEFRYKGRRYDLKVSIALANSGEVQLELIQQRNDAPSL
jgi:Glyoxalase/Bleomycin resistance protein/Dioxygenase superfamily